MRNVFLLTAFLGTCASVMSAEWDPEREIVPYYRHCNYGWEDRETQTLTLLTMAPLLKKL